MSSKTRSLAFIGGTGPEGLGLAIRFAAAGDEVIIGSRRQERADEAAQKIRDVVPNGNVRSMENRPAVEAADISFITVPFEGQAATCTDLKEALTDKIVVDTVVPLTFHKGKAGALIVEEGSAAEQAQSILSKSRVVGAFQNLSAPELMKLETDIPADVIVCGDDAEAKQEVMALAAQIKGLRAVDGGSLASSRFVEEITALLVNINKVYKAHSMIKIVGI